MLAYVDHQNSCCEGVDGIHPIHHYEAHHTTEGGAEHVWTSRLATNRERIRDDTEDGLKYPR